MPWYAYDCGAIVFRDLVGKLDVPHVECDKCGQRFNGDPTCGTRPPAFGRHHTELVSGKIELGARQV